LAATPLQQQAIVQTGAGGPDVLKLETVPVLEPGDRQILIRVYAAAVNPTDWKTRAAAAGYATAASGPAGRIIAGLDVAGVVEKTGSDVTGFKPGDPVFAVIVRVPKVLNGAYAQFSVAAMANVVHKPKGMSYAEAAGLGVVGVTGLRAVELTQVAKGQRVLITGVAGGVGSVAAQVAKARGAHVIGTASAQHNDYLHSIGVDEVVDYTQVRFEEQVKDVDVVIDTVGSDTADRAFATMKKGGMYVSVAARDLEAKCAAAGVTCIGRASAADLDRKIYDELGALADSGNLKIKVDRSFPLADAAQAQVYGERGHTEGKIILIVDTAHANRR
jgi:NADPH:quinone reductase-like Zn-dependent oxidoreductase